MLFNSIQYAVFLPIVVLLFWLSPNRFRVPILLGASYLFYMSWRPAYILLIVGLTTGNYFLGQAIANSSNWKKGFLAIGVTANLCCLGFFKYAGFFDETVAALLKPLGIVVHKIPFDIILPLGISFFVFEFIHYLTDIYRGSQPVKSFLGFALFASFFPTQIAGPIKRYQDFVPQFLKEPKFSRDEFDNGVALILTGLFKKVLIADNLSYFVQGGFAHPALFTGPDLWIFTWAFAFQIYFDFSGYTDVARGSAAMFGYKVPVNFNLPYLSKSIAEFWHRWHISLSTWLRDYLYISLGGSRCSRWKNYRNLFLTMLLGGLWHGAALHFLLWGAFHGAMLVAHREFERLTSGITFVTAFFESKIGQVVSMLITFQVVCLGWVLFRAENIASCLTILSKMFFLEYAQKGVSLFSLTLPSINYPLIYPSIYLLLPLLFVAHIVMGILNQQNFYARCPKYLKVGYCFALLFIVMVFSPDKSPRFIYFQF
jgi:D-alanyl-lipoteichoic acid acyltransferase DltB (MBOAT superfamily)